VLSISKVERSANFKYKLLVPECALKRIFQTEQIFSVVIQVTTVPVPVIVHIF
jgi:hypothetical protein